MSSLQQTLTTEDVRQARRIHDRTKFDSYYPDEGPLRRELYPKQQLYFSAGSRHRERLFLAANRVGKTEGVGAYEVTCHLTGVYPEWWEGRRFDHAVRVWAAGDTSKTVRDIMQAKMLGPAGQHGTGMIPDDLLIRPTRSKSGIADAVEIAYVKHATGEASTLIFKSYDQRREAFQGTEQDIIWLDEEPPEDIYTECLTRTMTTKGLIILTFTPLQGVTKLVEGFIPGGRVKSGDPVIHKYKIMVPCTWDEVPHLEEEEKERLYAGYPPHERDARSKGRPSLGAGAIYPVEENDITCDVFEIPEHYVRAYGLDVGWNRTAAIFGAKDLETGIIYLYAEYYRGQAEPVVHTEAIKGFGEWIPGVVDPAANGRGQKDGSKLFEEYCDAGLDLSLAVNALEAGLLKCYRMMTQGQLKIFKSCTNTLEEYRLYRRDKDGKVKKERDHLMDAMRYLIMSGIEEMKPSPDMTAAPDEPEFPYSNGPGGEGWMGA